MTPSCAASVWEGRAWFASRKNPRPQEGMSDLCGHLFGGERRAVVRTSSPHPSPPSGEEREKPPRLARDLP